jgi:hypothetical protein
MACLASRQSNAYNAHQLFEPVGSFVHLLTECRLKSLVLLLRHTGRNRPETTSTGEFVIDVASSSGIVCLAQGA